MTKVAEPPKDILVYGAGAIGLFIGGLMARGGRYVHFVARPKIVDALRRDGLKLTDLAGRADPIPSLRISASTTLAEAPRADLVLLTVKGSATVAAAEDLAARLPTGTPVISFQNGVDNPDRIRGAAPSLEVIAGMVPYNVVQDAPGVVRQTTGGDLMVARTAVTERLQRRLEVDGTPLKLADDMLAVQWGKLLLNLNNPVNALAGIPLREELLDRDYRRLLADLQSEGLAVLARAGIRPAQVTPLPTTWLPSLLRLPTWLFQRAANRMLTIHPEARSSMYDDRVAGRITEVGDLCGAVVRLAQKHGLDAPLNRRMVAAVENAPTGRFYSASELRELLGS